jgi:parvulin-like peptidyl-prolyl isomerase
MKLLSLLAFGCAAALYAQAPAATAPPPAAFPEMPPDTVIASFEGRNLTYGQLKAFVSVLDPQQQQLAAKNPKMLVHQYFLWQHLANEATAEKLDQKSPAKEQLDYNRTFILMQTKLNDVVRNMTVEEEELKKYYEQNKDKYSQVKVKTIYISFSSNPAEAGSGGKKVLSEEEAKAKIEKVLAEIRGGADFVKMVKQHSEDADSRDKDGDLGTFRRSDNLPDAIRKVVFSLKQGEVSEPVRQPNGFYLFRADQISTRTYQQEQMNIYEQAKQAKAQKWMNDVNASIQFKVENEAFFKAAAGAAPAPGAGAPPAH